MINMLKKLFLSLSFIISFAHMVVGQEANPVYKDSTASIEKRIDDLLIRMTLEEKFGQLFMVPGDFSEGLGKYKNGIFGFQSSTKPMKDAAGQIFDYSEGENARKTAEMNNRLQRFFLTKTRLGIPIIPYDEALHGLIRKGATAFPQAIALASTWDTALMSNVAAAIAEETRSRGIRQILSPVVNIARDVRWGRVEETYGEDPFLTSQMGIAFVSQFEKRGVITTPKHFVANVGDGGRDSYPIHYNERLLDEIFFPAFKACIQQGKSMSVMTAYNSLDGRPCTANHWLLQKKLKSDWGFQGFVISDAGATGGANVLHFTAENYAQSTKQAVENGLDAILQSSYNHYPLFWEAFKKRMIDDKAIDEAVRRVLRAKFKLGLFENPFVNPDKAANINGTKEHRALAKQAALESIVLLKNENNTLPLSKKIRSVAIIGTDAVEARLGGYSGQGNNKVNILKGLQNKLPANCTIKYAPGCGRKTTTFVTIPANNLFHTENGVMKPGLYAGYFNNSALSGKPDLVRTDPVIDFSWTLYSPDNSKINYDCYSVRWEGIIIPSQNGTFTIGLKGNDGYRLYINNELIVDNWRKQTFGVHTAKYNFRKGESYQLKVEFYETTGNAKIKLIWNAGVKNNWQQKITEAIKTAQQSDVAIVVAGIEEGEFKDRAHLSLPGKQEQLIRKVAATGKPVVVILVGGSAITMNDWIDTIPAIVDVWYPGEEGGNAIADVLFGDYNPAGRLPITFPVFEGQLPLYYNHKPTGRGDDYLDMTGKPLFPFGYGLSYTTFKYADITLSNSAIKSGDSCTVSFTVTNTGNQDGDEVVQLYIKDLYASVARPVMELKGFLRVHLKKGETKKCTFQITPDMLSMLDVNLKRVVEPGDFRILIGASSNDIRLRTLLTVY